MPSIGSYNRYLRVSGDFNKPKLNDVPIPRYIYDDDSSIYQWIESYTVARQMYQKSRPRPGEKHPSKPNTFFLKDSDLSAGRGTLADFTRYWIVLPTTTRGRQGYLVTTYEDYNFVVPGRGTGATGFVDADVTSYVRANGYITMTRSGHDIVAGMLVRVDYLVIDPVNNYPYSHTVVTPALSGTVAGSVVVIADIKNDKGPAIPRRFRRNDTVQTPYPRKVQCRVEKEHIVLGQNGITSFDIINRPTKYLDIIGADGNRTETLDTTSNPSIAQYEAKIVSGEWIVVEDATIAPYEEHSPLLVKTIKYVQATW